MAPHEFLSSILASGQFSDFTMICEGQEFRLHQAVVCPQSRVLNAALCGGFEEATTKVITVKDFDIATVKRLVSFFYTGDYDEQLPTESAHDEDTVVTDADADADADNDNEGNESDDQIDSANFHERVLGVQRAREEKTKADAIQALLFHLEVNAIADYYNIPGLRDLAESKVKKILLGNNAILPRLLQEVSSGAHANLYAIIAEVAAETYDISDLFSQDDTPFKLDPALYSKIIVACGLRMALLKNELKDVQGSYKTAQDLIATNKMAIITCHAKLGMTPKCRHCDEKFNCYIENAAVVTDSEPEFMLRCSSCRTRHP
ncbi:uncharacterized protein B0J16DRAFT_397624 [Fusarium flagelliforme]|uniref:uncharacterized protein n=1 Tax=Fusarium flagelliforme TaxID=2675880 RepID=UPI001E8D017D|nr:uncharacterized protein B0J16DRAFT_397624 [Fusarium flagelliforme]KAH7189658.1 hypothetical protein B0J16DRAFT_397624 [Fusarium flagelliforme]